MRRGPVGRRLAALAGAVALAAVLAGAFRAWLDPVHVAEWVFALALCR